MFGSVLRGWFSSGSVLRVWFSSGSVLRVWFSSACLVQFSVSGSVLRVWFSSACLVQFWFSSACLVQFCVFGSVLRVWFSSPCLVQFSVSGSVLRVWFSSPCLVRFSFSFSSRWHRSTRTGPYALLPVSQLSPQGCPRNSANICLVEHRSFPTLECGMSAASFLHSSFLQAINAVMLWGSLFRKVLKPRSTSAPSSCSFVCWLLNVPATCECISGTDLLRQFYVLPHCCRSNFPSHPVSVY